MKRLSLVAIALLATHLPSQEWHQNPANGHFYRLTGEVTWHQAEAEAVRLGGHLATVRNQDEHEWLVATFGGSSKLDAKWIGLSDEAVEGQFVWSSGEPVTFTCWDVNQPDDYLAMEDFVTHVWDTPCWNDFFGTEILPGIVEIISDQASSFSLFGDGCAGREGVPVLDAKAGSQPVIGSVFTLELTNLPTGLFAGNAFVIVGFSKDEWIGMPLPLDLTQYGIPGCASYVSIDVAFPVSTFGGAAEWSVEVPIDPNLLGKHFYTQGLIQDIGVNPSGAVVTNAAEGVIGVR